MKVGSVLGWPLFHRALLLAVVLCWSCIWVRELPAQQLTGPRIGYVYPAGGRQGATFDVRLGGQFLDGVTNAFFSGSGISGSVLNHTKPLTVQQANALREKLKELQQKRAEMSRRRKAGTNTVWTASDLRTMEEIRARLAAFQRRPANPAIAETVTLRVTVTPGAATGPHELRLSTPQGLSNPLRFVVGQLPEVREADAGRREPVDNRKGFRRNAGEAQAVPASQMSVAIPVLINGQILQGGVDRFRFHANAGQKLVLAVAARELVPYLPDAVPGWFQATLAVRDQNGTELGYNDDFRFSPDPVLLFEVPKSGDYIAEVRDAIYRGREDFVYRLSIAESPFLTSVFPLGAPAHSNTVVKLQGWNLPVSSLVAEWAEGCSFSSLRVTNAGIVSNPLPFTFSELPEAMEQEANDSRETAQPALLPLFINGVIQKPGDLDVFSFEGRTGQEVVAEIMGRRLGSPIDSALRLLDTSWAVVASNDDHEDKGSGLNTHHADSYVKAVLPTAGRYYVQVRDAQGQGGAEFAYRLRLSEPQPDFELRIVPSSINIRAGMNSVLTAYALRRDGFTNEISLQLSEAPTGFGASGARIPAGQDQVRFTISGPPQKETQSISFEGSVFVGGKRIVKKAIPADDMMQAFAYHHLVPAQQMLVYSSGRTFPRNPGGVRLLTSGIKIPRGGTATARFNAPGFAMAGRFELELSDPPEGLSIEKLIASNGGAELVLRADSTKSVIGTKGNLIANVTPKAAAGAKNKKQAAGRRPVLGVLPAIPFEIVDR